MSAHDARPPIDDSPEFGRLVDHLLGEGSDAERSEVRAEIGRDVELAVELGDLRGLFDEMRTLTIEPSGHVGIALRYAAGRRARLRGERKQDRVARMARVAAVAAAALVAFLFIDDMAQREVSERGAHVQGSPIVRSHRVAPAIDPVVGFLLSSANLPVRDVSFLECLEAFDERPLPESFSGWVDASERLHALRESFRLRLASEERHRLLRSMGSPKLDDRLESLADDVVAQVHRQLTRNEMSIDDLSLAVRAMVATGSSRVHGRHHDVVHRCAYEILQRFEGLDEGEAASALAALSELAVLEGGRLVDIVGRHAARLARSTLTARADGSRPGLLHWRTSSLRLADAGRVLQIAPAFGVHAGISHRARMMIAAHLDERMQVDSDVEVPSLIAAQLYGFGDLIDREAADRALRLWNPRLLVPDFVALHHLAWSRAPTRPGWARFQQQLRDLASVPTPARVRDSASLLLSLTMNFAAPASLGEIVARGS